MSNRRNSPPIAEEYGSSSATKSTLTRSRASSNSLTSVSSVNSLNGLLSSPSTTTAAATTMGSSTAVLVNGHTNGTNGNTSPGASSSTYYPAFPYRNKSRTPSVSSTSTITQPIHSLLQTSSGILPKRHAAPVSAAPTLSIASAASYSPPSSSPTNSNNNSINIKYSMANGNGVHNGAAPATAAIDTASNNSRSAAPSTPILVLEPINDNFALKSLELPENSRIKIGRQTGVTTAPNPANGYFDSKVLSRVHAEVWSENGKVFIRDLKSSNGTFLNGKRLCPENVESEPFILNQNDHLEFGIDILDENGSLLHEKVACKIYISRMSSYPTPGGSPQESPAKLHSGSPTGSGPSSVRSNSVSGGQSTNIDLIISRLQNELTRSQETNADLGSLKQGLGELERAITVPIKEDEKAGSETLNQVAEYQRLLEENNKLHAMEIAKLNRQLEETQSELSAYVQKIQFLEPLVAEDEILKRDIAQSTAELTKVRLERDLAKDSLNELINEHQQSMNVFQKEQEAIMAALEANHKETLESMAREAALAQELMIQKYQEDLAKALQSAAAPETESTLASLKTKVNTLQETVENQTKLIQELNTEKKTLSQALSETKAEVIKVEKKLEEVTRPIQEELSSLTPTSPSSTSFICKHPECRDQAATIKSTSRITTVPGTSGRESKDLITRLEFSWAQFLFPDGKKNPPQLNQQPSTMLVSGGFMLVGIGAYAFWHKGGFR
ncbi:hypothetical protein BGX26_011521 [Mortierella sp. AD094]|nr:hypothetical protein BGX26_011521 [Mortierella sp. AD094]